MNSFEKVLARNPLGEDVVLGYKLTLHSFLVFFGARDSKIESLKLKFPELAFSRLNQVHGVDIIDAGDNDNLSEADGQFSHKLNQALCINTADCLPVMVCAKVSNMSYAMALHAGWRGVVDEIIPKGLEKFLAFGADPKSIQVFIGPHINKTSFEIGSDVAKLLGKAYCENHPSTPGKFLADLTRLATDQIMRSGTALSQIHHLSFDTFSDRKFHSFRRDGTQAGRQISFIARIS